MLLLVDLLRIVAWCLSWLVVWLNQLADALEYREQTMRRIDYQPMSPKTTHTVQVQYEVRGRAKPNIQPLDEHAIPVPVKW